MAKTIPTFSRSTAPPPRSCVSDIPFAGPIGAVRVGRVNGEFIANPTHSEREQSDLDLVYVGTENDIIMIEGAADELPEEEFVKSLEFAHGHAKEMIRIQKELAAQVGKPKREMPLMEVKPEILQIADRVAGDRIEAALYTEGKVARSKAVGGLRDEVKAAVLEQFPDADKFAINQAFDYIQKKSFRSNILDKQKRVDGRGYEDLRQITCEVGVLPRAHGSAIFQRGETQAMALATLAPIEEAQNIDAYGGGETSKRFLLHYNFPPFSVGETGRFGGASRREIGHGALAERSVEPVVPSQEDFRYAIRVVSEVMESNGSTSMASVCSGMLALMDAGVPIKTPVAGISVGLVTENDEQRQPETLQPAHRHHRFRRSFRRHGFQTLRNQGWRHRFPARPQAPGREPQDSRPKRSTARKKRAPKSSPSWPKRSTSRANR